MYNPDKSINGDEKEAQLGKDLFSIKDRALSFDLGSEGERNLINKTKSDTVSYKIVRHKKQQEYINSNNEFVSIDQITTPVHPSFENELEYQNVLKNVF